MAVHSYHDAAGYFPRNAGPNFGRRLYYLAVSPTLYTEIVQQLTASGLSASSPEAWSRLLNPESADLAGSFALFARERVIIP